MRRLSGIAAAFSAAVLLLTGCGGGDTPTEPVVSPHASLSFLTAHDTGAPAGTGFPGGVAVKLLNVDGKPAVGYTITFATGSPTPVVKRALSDSTTGSPTPVVKRALSDSLGVARSPVVLSSVTGSQRVVASIDTLGLSLRDTLFLASTGPLRFLVPAAGRAHTCATATSPDAYQQVYCWGRNAEGELGIGVVSALSTSPRMVRAPTGPSFVIGGDATCSGGYCWGSNVAGQLGAPGPGVPVPQRGLVPEASVFGLSHACTLNYPGGAPFATCWGSNAHGELGDGSTTSRSTPKPVDASGMRGDVWRVVAGDGFTCAVTHVWTTAESNVYCWGRNDFGQLGDGTTTDRATPVRVLGIAFRNVPGIIPALSVGGAHACVVVGETITEGSVSSGGQRRLGKGYCWGRNDSGQLGNGTLTNSSTATLALGGEILEYFQLGAEHSCRSGQCWGSNRYGQLGIGTGEPYSLTPRSPVTPAGVAFVSLATVGAYHSCGTTGGAYLIYCWGLNADGQLGDGTTTNRALPTRVVDFRP